MSKMDFDPVDAGLFVLGLMATLAMVGISSHTLFDVTFSDMVFPNIGEGVSLATAITGAVMIGTVVTNDNAELDSLASDVQDLDQYYYAAVVIAAGGLVGWVFVPEVQNFFTSSDLWGIVYVGITMTAQMALGWML